MNACREVLGRKAGAFWVEEDDLELARLLVARAQEFESLSDSSISARAGNVRQRIEPPVNDDVEQVQSLGGELLEVPGFELQDTSTGYAKEMSKEFIEAEMALSQSCHA